MFRKMTANQCGYTIFPTTWKARLLLAIAFLGGLAIIGSFVAAFALVRVTSLTPEIYVTYENRTDGSVTIEVDGRREAIVPPHQSVTFKELELGWLFGRRVKAIEDATRREIFSQELDRDDLKRLGYRIVITKR